MRLLDRRSVPTPTSLGRYSAGTHQWSALATTSADYREVCELDLPRFGRQFYYAAATFVPSLNSNSTGLM